MSPLECDHTLRQKRAPPRFRKICRGERRFELGNAASEDTFGALHKQHHGKCPKRYLENLIEKS